MKNGTHHVFDFLDENIESLPQGVCVMFGGERYLKRKAAQHLLGDADDFSASRFDGNQAQLADVLDELSTQSLFGGGGPKVVVIDDADSFVKQHRNRLEDLVDSRTSGLLILLVDTWAANTKLYKRVNKEGIQIRCTPPTPSGKSNKTDTKRVAKWLIQQAADEHEFKLPAAGAQMLIDLTDCEFGRMDQELQKLALYADKGKVTVDTVGKVVGGWRTQTMWDAIGAAVDGDSGKALTLLDRLLKNGEHPLALFGQLSWSLRRYASATENVLRQVRDGKRPDMSSAISAAGFRPWGGEVDMAHDRLKQLGRDRAARILDWLVEADFALKRSHTTGDRGRLALEKMLVRMSKELSPAAIKR